MRGNKMRALCGTIFAVVMPVLVCSGTTSQGLYSGWRFHRGDAFGAESVAFDDSSWEKVSIPHDWAIAGPFSSTNDVQRVAIKQDGETVETVKLGRTGALPWVGVGWYRRTIAVPADAERVELAFDGAMSNSRVFVDGVEVGGRPNGYVPFVIEITDVLRKPFNLSTIQPSNSFHVLAVRLDNAPQSSRWYPGAGLYRPVRLVPGRRCGFATWGTFVRTTALSESEARVAVTEEVREASGNLSVAWRILDEGGRVVASAAGEVSSNAAEGVLSVAAPRRWSPDSPALYTLESELNRGGEVLDLRRTRFGIRTVELTKDGFLLNGDRLDFRGVCLHHDLGAIGAAFNPSAFRRQVHILKEMGCNAIRTSHNSPAPEQLDICDEMGVLVMAESFDEWKTPKCQNGYSRFFAKWWERDLENIVRCHRSHPSVVMWSIGNEIWEADLRDGAFYGRKMVELCHRLDPSRPVTQGVDRPDKVAWTGALQLLDVPGLNYQLPKYGIARKASRTGLVLGSETASTVSSRGEYFLPDSEGKGMKRNGSQCSSYDLECCPWGNLPDDDWAMQDDSAWTIGEFVWTGFDYLGEPTPYGAAEYWPSRSAYFGIVDLAGIPKDRYWLYRSHWRKDVPTLHVLPHWTWPGREGEAIPVYVYTSWPMAELFVNGVSQGRRAKDPTSRLDRYRLRWRDVKYVPGELKVVAYDVHGRIAGEKVVKTAGEPRRVELLPEAAALRATPVSGGEESSASELGYVRVRIVDGDGNLCPDATNRVSFSVSGAAAFKGACNGDATSLEPFVKSSMPTFHGEMMLVVEAGRSPGIARIEASSAELEPVAVTLDVE